MISSEEGIRLAKRVAADQNCSRREAEALIVAGGVQVDGKVVTDPARRVKDEQAINVNRLVSMAALATLSGEVPESLVKALNGPGTRASINRQTDTVTVLRIAGKDIDGLELGRWLDEQCPLQDLRRQRVGRLSLAPLEPGQWRQLEGYERF